MQKPEKNNLFNRRKNPDSLGMKQRLFDRYYRGTNTGEGHKGSGLDMAIAKQIV
ncbi:hypothetical protein [Clostridium sp.]|uniref:hypothetical protein n=1 Tax=Clostridium sp. TaxID=1506 RepID=UPI002FC79909